jgi:hypothetical protein
MKVSQSCIIVGDFNVTISSQEKKGGSMVRDPLREKVEELIEDWDLIDIKPIRGKYTWSNNVTPYFPPSIIMLKTSCIVIDEDCNCVLC